MDKPIVMLQLAGALAEEGCSLEQIVETVTEALKGIGESPFHSVFMSEKSCCCFFFFRLTALFKYISGTLGVSLSPCSVPGCLPSFDLPPGDMELGLGETEERMLLCKKQKSQLVYKKKKMSFSGIHGEPGIKRSKVIPVQFATSYFSVLCL